MHASQHHARISQFQVIVAAAEAQLGRFSITAAFLRRHDKGKQRHADEHAVTHLYRIVSIDLASKRKD